MKKPKLSIKEFNDFISTATRVKDVIDVCGFCGDSYKKEYIDRINNFYNCDIRCVVEKNKKRHFCKLCGREFYEKNGKYSSWDFCSKKCSAQYSQSFCNDNTKHKISESLKKWYLANPKQKSKIKYICSICNKEFYENKRFNKYRNIHCPECRRKNTSNMSIKEILTMMSFTTIQRVLRKTLIPCSICGWNKTTCDIHHIIPKKEGGTDDISNLIIICPNCHREIHNGVCKKTREELQELSIDKTLLNDDKIL